MNAGTKYCKWTLHLLMFILIYLVCSILTYCLTCYLIFHILLKKTLSVNNLSFFINFNQREIWRISVSQKSRRSDASTKKPICLGTNGMNDELKTTPVEFSFWLLSERFVVCFVTRPTCLCRNLQTPYPTTYLSSLCNFLHRPNSFALGIKNAITVWTGQTFTLLAANTPTFRYREAEVKIQTDSCRGIRRLYACWIGRNSSCWTETVNWTYESRFIGTPTCILTHEFGHGMCTLLNARRYVIESAKSRLVCSLWSCSRCWCLRRRRKWCRFGPTDVSVSDSANKVRASDQFRFWHQT